MSSEQARLEWLRSFLNGGPREGVSLGVGDDAAVVRARDGESLVCTVDAQVEGVHFHRAWLTWEEMGFRATMAAASDLAAMGARPFCMLAALTLPKNVDDQQFQALVRGQKRAADELDASIVGGNLSGGTELSIATTWMGRTMRPVGRAGARPGDLLQVAGTIGAAHVGLSALRGERHDAVLEPAVSSWKVPRARVLDGLRMSPSAHAAIDLSDGLAIDVERLAKASGVRAVLHERDLEREAAPLRAASDLLGFQAQDAVCFGGEDYALLVSTPHPIQGFRTIGYVQEGSGVCVDRGGALEPLVARGFDHFVP